MVRLEEGHIGCLEDFRHGRTMIKFRCASESDWSILLFRIDLGVMRDESRGTVVLSIFAPFWFVNKT